MSDGTHDVYLGLGTNLGNREEHIRQAIRLVGERVGRVVRQSSVIETEPWGFETANKFLNAVILCRTSLSPRQLLATTQQIEHDMGKSQRHATVRSHSTITGHEVSSYKDRPIDIDILLYDDLTVDEPGLKIPHPMMHQRDFVMIPLGEVRGKR